MLKDRDTYPYFLRTVPADDKQASAMVALLRKLKFTYVQVYVNITTQEIFTLTYVRVCVNGTTQEIFTVTYVRVCADGTT